MSRLHRSMQEIPAILGVGFSWLPECTYLLCCVRQRAAVRAWLADLLQAGLVKSLDQVRQLDEAVSPPMPQPEPGGEEVTEAVTFCISHAGLSALGQHEDPLRPFPSAFRAGMGHPLRRLLLGEDPVGPDGKQGMEPWDWNDCPVAGDTAVHLLIVHYRGRTTRSHPLLDPAHMADRGLQVRAVPTDPGAFRTDSDGRISMHEPFGFRDGVGQPDIVGLAPRRRGRGGGKDPALHHPEANLVQPGEFILGHRNEYGEDSYTPNLVNWPAGPDAPEYFGSHGSYLAVRQIHQDVAVFEQYVKASAVPRLARKMMGRSELGWPLVTGPHRAATPDDFLYLASDATGFECPRGAHVRRAHVRDALAYDEVEGIENSRLHRLLRRGRVYLDGAQSPASTGTMFVALNADLDRQFEFVHRNWIMGSRFGGLSDEQDPILGTRLGRMFTVPACPLGQRVGPLPRFTRVLGGGYFFVPAMSALRFLARS